jgi:hypothetical protein
VIIANGRHAINKPIDEPQANAAKVILVSANLLDSGANALIALVQTPLLIV